MNFQITVILVFIIGGIAGTILAFIPIIGFIIVILMFIVFAAISLGFVVFSIIAAVAASKGTAYRYPIALRLIK